tara:strand:+ start:1719 stop:2222 length:504 start_codon:yes stop_codon:yes gene_type:complete
MTYITLQNHKNLNEINKDIFERNIPSENMQVHLPQRSVSTKYSHFPILDSRKETNVLLNYSRPYDNSQMFFPGNRKPHFCGFARNVDLESDLRNQFFALQKADQAAYVPNSSSNMYENNINFINTNKNLDNELLFNEEDFNNFNPNLSNIIGSEIFLNSTRVQLKNL